MPQPDETKPDERPAARPDAISSEPSQVPVFVSGGLELLYDKDPIPRCDACDERVALHSEADPEDPYAVSGAGEYMQARGADVRFDTVPLCARCGTAIFAAALTRWAIEDEEG